jgi:hypothetical protein
VGDGILRLPRCRMVINVALEDGFDGDEVVIRVDGTEAFRAQGVTTRTQISHAGDTQLDVPDRPFTLEVEVPTQEVGATLQIDPHAQPNVALSVMDGRVVAAYPERIGFV